MRYQLEFLGDYQTGAWDTDAAENVAYDKLTKRAFLASAESGTVQVVDISSPHNLGEVATVQVSALMATHCTDVDCDYEDMDFGGGSAPCGYAPMVNIIFDKGNCDACTSRYEADGVTRKYCDPKDCVYTSSPGYNAGGLAVDAAVGTVEGCRAACQADPACEFFSWESEVRRLCAAHASPPRGLALWLTACVCGVSPLRPRAQLWTQGDQVLYSTPGVTARAARCFLKAAFGIGTTDRDGNVLANPGDCNSYVHWEAHKGQTERGDE